MADFGLVMFPTDFAMDPGELAFEAESRGFESLFFPEHTHIPDDRRSPWPGGPELPRDYWHCLDPFVALMAAGSRTKTIKLGTGICLVTERDPILMAKQVATLDRLTGGRVILGIGAGWNAEEMANHGVDFKVRWKVLRERVLAMRNIWTDELPEFHGEFVNFDPIRANPKPTQKGGPQILMGASSKWSFDRAVEYCDGWMPIEQSEDRAKATGAFDLRAGLRDLDAAAERAGRDPKTLDRSIFMVGPDPSRVEELINMGFNRIVFGLPARGADKVLPLLDKYAETRKQLA